MLLCWWRPANVVRIGVRRAIREVMELKGRFAAKSVLCDASLLAATRAEETDGVDTDDLDSPFDMTAAI